MAFHNTNYTVTALTGGTYNTGQLGNNITAATIHQIYCLSAGSIIITPCSGPTFTWNATANQSIPVMVSTVTVSSGNFIGFSAKFNSWSSSSTAITY